MTDVQVENIIVFFQITPSLDLEKIAAILPDAKYNPADVPVLILQFQKPRSVVTLFSTGNTVVTGPKSMDEVHEVHKMLRDRLMVVGVQPEGDPEFHVQTVTASVDMNRPLDLKFLATSLSGEYDPAVFPGLVYKGDDPNTVILLFDSGKIVCNGATLEEISVAVEKLMEKLLSFGIRKEEKVCQK